MVAYHLLSLLILLRNVSHMPKSVSVTKQNHLEGQLSIFFVFPDQLPRTECSQYLCTVRLDNSLYINKRCNALA